MSTPRSILTIRRDCRNTTSTWRGSFPHCRAYCSAQGEGVTSLRAIKQRQVTWLVDIERDPWDTPDLYPQMTLGCQAQMALKAVMAKGEWQTVWRRQENGVRAQIVPIGHQHHRHWWVWRCHNGLHIR